MKIYHSIIGLGAFSLLNSTVLAGNVQWGGALGSTVANYESDGDELENDIGDVIFELGIFEDGFVPTRENAADWEANWLAFTGTGRDELYGTGAQPTFFGADSTAPVAIGNKPGESSNADFPIDSRVYIWGYNTQDISTEPAEWFLVTGDDGTDTGASDTNWVVPSDEGGNGAFTLVWDINNASTAIVGRIDDTVTDPTPGVSVAPVLGQDDIQFAVIPEPSSFLLTLLGLSLAMRRSRA